MDSFVLAVRSISSSILQLLRDYIWTNPWRVIAVVLLGANLKVLPFVWHVRVFSALSSHLVLHRKRRVTASEYGGSAIFEPVVTQSGTPLMELDFNLHKSNSTFFTDLDVSRIHLLSTLFKDVIDPSLSTGPTKDGRLGGLKAALGGVSMNFHREIKPFQNYEVWSRVLTWDEKWIFIVSHFVIAGGVEPKAYRLTPFATTRRRPKYSKEDDSTKEVPREFSCSAEDSKKFLYASAISKYVFKQGRKTIPLSTVLSEIHLLPRAQDSPSDNGWTLTRVEEERLQGLKLASNFAALDGITKTFSGGSSLALGRF